MPDPGHLSLHEVSAGYARRVNVVHGVSARFAAGRITVLIGPNGSGKSTLARVLAGVMTLAHGVARLDDTPLSSLSRTDLARRVAYVPQKSLVSEPMTARDVVAIGLYASRRDDDAVRRAMERTGMWDRRDTIYERLSAGQQQRVSLARALAQLDAGRPLARGSQFLIADEPVAAQDPRQIGIVMGCLREEASAGRGVVVILHDLTLAARGADDAVALQDGRLVAAGPSREVLSESTLAVLFGVQFQRLDLAPGAVAIIPAAT